MKKQSTKAKVESFIEDLKIIKVDEYDIGVCFIGYEYRNEVADYLKDTMKYDIDAVAMFAFENNQISLRSIKDNSSARIVAEKYGGGGHDKAAAIHITKEMKSSIIDLIF
jgi:oligoribonuclease NrnB/cAMP/cGMP phosphodiesterase (DHH superfamily)